LSLESILSLAEKLIAVRSVTGEEIPAMQLMESELTSRGFSVERLPVANDPRWNLLAAVGKPRIILTTHLDVVPAPDSLFTPVRKEGRLWGRGSCDAKGIAATMVEAVTSLVQEGVNNIGLLFVVEEETVSSGAKAAAPFLKERGVEYIVNGEPTECCLVSGHKGALTLEVLFQGKPAHSGYPHLGDDANNKLIRTCARLMETDFGKSDVLGKATINLGSIEGGVATNVVSPHAKLRCLIRTVTTNSEVQEIFKSVVTEASEINVKGSSEPVVLVTVPGFETGPVAYGTDIPYLMKSGAKCLLFGPGTIEVAHTDFESVEFSQLELAFDGYKKIVRHLAG